MTNRYKSKRNKKNKRNTKKRGGYDKIYITEYDEDAYINIYKLLLKIQQKYIKKVSFEYLVDTLYGTIPIEELRESRDADIENVKQLRVEFINELLNKITIPSITSNNIISIKKELPVGPLTVYL